MSKLLLVAERQFRQEVFKRGFLFALFSMPMFLALTLGMGFLTAELEEGTVNLGYVDQAGLLVDLPPADDQVQLLSFASPAAAQQALESGQIDAYYLLPADFRASGQAEMVYDELPRWQVTQQFEAAVRLNLLAGQPLQVTERVLAGTQVTVQSLSSGRSFPEGGPAVGLFVPLISSVLFAFLMLITSATLMLAVVEEKLNRTVEVVVTSLSTGRLMAGKVVGVVAMGLILLAAWLVFLLAAVWIGADVIGLEWLQQIAVDWRDIGGMVLVALPVFLFYAAFMTTLGSALVDSEEAQQVGALSFLALMFPIYLIVPISQNPDGLLSMALSLLPFTSVTTLALRSLFDVVPTGQFVAAALIALVTGIGLTLLAGKALRISMLRYGQRLKLSDLVAR